MWFLVWMTVAAANPDPPFPRAEESLRVRRYLDVVGEGPMWPRYRRSLGPVRAWTWPDGVIEHYERLERGRPVEVHRFDASGHPLTSVALVDEQPATVTVHGDAARQVDVATWTAHPVGTALVRLPLEAGSPEDEAAPGAGEAPGGGEASGDVPEPPAPLVLDLALDGEVDPAPATRLTVAALPLLGDPFTDAFRAGLAETCDCRIEGWTTAWVDGRRAARFRVRVIAPDAPWAGEIWAASTETDTLVVSAMVPDRATLDEQTLARGRAVVALIRWREE